MIRQLTHTDTAAYRTLRLKALCTEPDAFVANFETESQKSELFMERCLKANDPFNIMFGYFTGDILAGIAGFIKNEHPDAINQGEIIQLYVDPEHRNSGVGLKLMQAVLNFAFSKFVELNCINIAVVLTLKNAGNLYKTLGFIPLPQSISGIHKHNSFDILFLQLNKKGYKLDIMM